MSRAPVATAVTQDTAGHWRVEIYSGGRRIDVSSFRGAPTEISQVTFTDPFGPAAATLRFPAITALETPGAGELAWLEEEADLDLTWVEVAADGTETVGAVWEGYIGSLEWQLLGMTATCVGALREYDNYLAMPRYLERPLAYERAIAEALEVREGMQQMQPLEVEWPADWPTKFNPKAYRGVTAPYLLPETYHRTGYTGGGANWTGLVTRETGRFEPILTSYVAGVLQNMQAPTGAWTIDLARGRQPVLRVRPRATLATPGIWRVDLLSPGVKDFSARKDHTQKANVVFGQGKSITGATYTGMRVEVDVGENGESSSTEYDPYAAMKAVHPESTTNPWFDRRVKRKEVSIPFSEGLSEAEARDVAQLHLQRFADPGITGQVTIAESLEQLQPDGTWVRRPRQRLRAGDSFLLMGLHGQSAGVLMHCTESTLGADGSVSLTLDSRYRDQLTVSEVRQRGRDALRPARLLTVGQYEPLIPDLLFPWSYDRGSGYIPARSKELWRPGLADIANPEQLDFPWTELTTALPPKDNERLYARIGPVDYTNAEKNWAVFKRKGEKYAYGLPVQLASAGDIRLVQIAAYDEDGNVLPVTFHASLYYFNAITPEDMPKMFVSDKQLKRINEARAAEGEIYSYKNGQAYPFFPNAFNTGFNENGTRVLNANKNQGAQSLIIGWGNGYERCGYWPGSQEGGDEVTGLFVDETPFSFSFLEANTRAFARATNAASKGRVGGAGTKRPPQSKTGIITARIMIYCDDHGDQPVYFLGRMYRASPGSQA